MKKTLIGLALLTSTLLHANENVKKDLNSNSGVNYELQLISSVIPNTAISKYELSEIQGFYKVYLDNGNIFYVNPFSKLLVFGEIWTNGGFSITQNDRSKWQSELSQTILKSLNEDYKVEI